MSSQEQRAQPIRRLRSVRRRKPVLDVDLNVVPSSEARDQVGSSAAQGIRGAPPAPIDVEAFDDDVIIISSPRAFAEAKNNSRRNRGRAAIVDVDSEEASTIPPITRSKRRRGSMNQTLTNCDLLINLEASSTSMRDCAKCDVHPPPPPKEITFTCPVCMGPLVEEVSTKCGHIFCKACIKAAIAAQSKCPSCRRRVTAKDIIRVYLPAASSCS